MFDELQPEEQVDDSTLLEGMFIAWALNILHVVLVIGLLGFFPESKSNLLLLSVPLAQWLYLVPLIRWADRSGKTARSQGLIIAGSITLLLLGTCFGFTAFLG
jgi:hypothetical protein